MQIYIKFSTGNHIQPVLSSTINIMLKKKLYCKHICYFDDKYNFRRLKHVK